MKNWMAFWTTLSTMAAVVLLCWAIKRPPATSGEVAAWVQAIGSVVAIIVAILIGQSAAKRARHVALEVQNREAAARIEIAIFVASQSRDLAQALERRFHLRGPALSEIDFSSVQEGIDRLPMSELRSGALVAKLLTLRRLVGGLEGLSVEFEGMGGPSLSEPRRMIYRSRLLERSDILLRVYGDIENAAQAALTRLSDTHQESAPGT